MRKLDHSGLQWPVTAIYKIKQVINSLEAAKSLAIGSYATQTPIGLGQMEAFRQISMYDSLVSLLLEKITL